MRRPEVEPATIFDRKSRHSSVLTTTLPSHTIYPENWALQPANGYGKIHGITCCIPRRKWLSRSRGKLFRRKVRAAYREIFALKFYETNVGETIAVKNTRKIFRGISALIFATSTDSLLTAELTPRNSVFNFRVNCRHPKAIAGPDARDTAVELMKLARTDVFCRQPLMSSCSSTIS